MILQPWFLAQVHLHPTCIFLQVWEIQCLLLKSVKDKDIVIKDMVELMMEKFDRYCGEYSVVLTFGAILEPRMKLKTLGYCYEMINPLGK